MRFPLPLLLLTFLALSACQQRPESFQVKEASFGTWAEYVERWNHTPGITGIGELNQPDTEWKLARPVWHADYPGYLVDFGYGATLQAIVKDGKVVRFRLAFAGGEGAGAQRFQQGVSKSIVVTGIAARWDEPAVLRVAEEINKSSLKSRTIIEGGYALNLVNDAKLGLSLDVGGK